MIRVSCGFVKSADNSGGEMSSHRGSCPCVIYEKQFPRDSQGSSLSTARRILILIPVSQETPSLRSGFCISGCILDGFLQNPERSEGAQAVRISNNVKMRPSTATNHSVEAGRFRSRDDSMHGLQIFETGIKPHLDLPEVSAT